MPVLKLNSLHLLFQALEKKEIDLFTSRLIILMRDGDLALPLQQMIQGILKNVAPLTNSATFIYALASSVVLMETPDMTEKRKLAKELIDLTNAPEASSDLLELVAGSIINLMLEEELPLEEKKELVTQLHQMTLCRNATSDVLDIYARGLFNISVDEPNINGKRAYTHQLRTLALYGKGTVTTRIHAAKAYVNLGCFTHDEGERVNCLATLEKLVHKPGANAELRNIYANGLFNFIVDDDNQETFRNRYFQKLKKLAQAPGATWDIRKLYAHSLLYMALYTENIREKRRYVRQIMEMVEMPGCVPEIFVTAGRAVFNHQIDETSLKYKKKAILMLEMILKRSGNAPSVLRDYARSLVNIATEDQPYENKRRYSDQLLKLTETKNPSLDIVLEYAKSLLNLVLSEESDEQKIKDLTTILSIDQNIHYRKANLSENTRVNYLCVKAEAMTIMLSLEPDLAERRKILSKIPKVDEIKESDYFKVFVDIFKDSVEDETDPSLKQELREMYDSFVHIFEVSMNNKNLLDILKQVDEKKLDVSPNLLKDLVEKMEEE